MPTSYEPLHLPPDDNRTLKSRVRDFFTLRMTRRAQFLVDQLEAREAVPPEIWGPDPRRQELAIAISEIIKEEIQWPNANFVPDDPFSLVLFNIYWDGSAIDGCEIECIAMKMEELTGNPIDVCLWSAMYDATFGETIDTLLALESESPVALKRGLEIPLSGPDSVEARKCPSMALFLEIRECLRRPYLDLGPLAFRPSTRVRDVLPRRTIRDLSMHILHRFRVSRPPWYDNAWRDSLSLGLTATMIVVVGWSLFIAWLLLTHPLPPADWSVLWSPLFFVVPGLLVTLRYVLPSLVILVSERLGYGPAPRIITFADLVRWILAERSKDRARMSGNET